MNHHNRVVIRFIAFVVVLLFVSPSRDCVAGYSLTTTTASSSLVLLSASSRNNHNRRPKNGRNSLEDQRHQQQQQQQKKKIGSSRLNSSSSSSADTDNDTTGAPVEERRKANSIMIYCAQILAVSSVVDLVVEGGSELVRTVQTGQWFFPVTTLWKLTFSYSLYKVSRLYHTIDNNNATVSSTTITTQTANQDNVKDVYTVIEQVLRSMTGIWRRLAFFVALLTMHEVILVWREALPNIRTILHIAFVVVGFISAKLSTKETQHLIMINDDTVAAAAAATTATTTVTTKTKNDNTDNNDTNNDTSSLVVAPPIASPQQRIVHSGRITVRAMGLCVAAFVLDSILTPVVAVRKVTVPDKKYGAAILDLVNLTTSIPFATLLWKLRKAYIIFLQNIKVEEEGIATPKANAKPRTTIKPELQINLAIAQQKFWGEIKTFLQTEMVLKVIAVVGKVLLSKK